MDKKYFRSNLKEKTLQSLIMIHHSYEKNKEDLVTKEILEEFIKTKTILEDKIQANKIKVIIQSPSRGN